jgi:hypothetical protein
LLSRYFVRDGNLALFNARFVFEAMRYRYFLFIKHIGKQMYELEYTVLLSVQLFGGRDSEVAFY